MSRYTLSFSFLISSGNLCHISTTRSSVTWWRRSTGGSSLYWWIDQQNSHIITQECNTNGKIGWWAQWSWLIPTVNQDEECLRPGEATDLTFLEKLEEKMGGHPHFVTWVPLQALCIPVQTLCIPVQTLCIPVQNVCTWIQSACTHALYPGTGIHFPGTDSLCPGTDSLCPGTDSLWPGTDALWPGTDALWPGTDALCPGTEMLHPGNKSNKVTNWVRPSETKSSSFSSSAPPHLCSDWPQSWTASQAMNVGSYVRTWQLLFIIVDINWPIRRPGKPCSEGTSASCTTQGKWRTVWLVRDQFQYCDTVPKC